MCKHPRIVRTSATLRPALVALAGGWQGTLAALAGGVLVVLPLAMLLLALYALRPALP